MKVELFLALLQAFFFGATFGLLCYVAFIVIDLRARFIRFCRDMMGIQ